MYAFPGLRADAARVRDFMSVGIVCTGKYFITTDGVGEMLYKRPGTHGLGAHSCLLSVNILEKSEAAYQQNVII